MSFVDVFPTEPVIATTRALLRVTHRPPDRCQRRKLIVRDERRRGAARARVVEKRDAATDRDEQIARRHTPRVDFDACHVRRVALQPAETAKLVERQRNQVRAPRVRSASRADSRSSNGTVRSANSCPCSAPLPAISTTSPSCASSIACAIARARSGSTSTAPAEHRRGSPR